MFLNNNNNNIDNVLLILFNYKEILIYYKIAFVLSYFTKIEILI